MKLANPIDTITDRVAAIRASIEVLRAEESRLEREFYSGSFRPRADRMKAPEKHEGGHGVLPAKTMDATPILGEKVAG